MRVKCGQWTTLADSNANSGIMPPTPRESQKQSGSINRTTNGPLLSLDRLICRLDDGDAVRGEAVEDYHLGPEGRSLTGEVTLSKAFARQFRCADFPFT